MHIFSVTFVQKRSQMKKISIALLLACLFLSVSCTRSRYIAIGGYAQGGTYTVKLNMEGVTESETAIRETVDSLLVLIDNTLSGYNKGSQLSRLNAGGEIEPNSMFRDIYAKSYEIWKETGGAVDVASGPLFDAWGFGFTNDSLPSAETVAGIMEDCGMDRLFPDLEESLGQHPVLNFNAIAQGYSCDVIAGYLHSIGVKDMLVDIGEIYCEGVNPDGNPWSIGVDTPVDGNNTLGAELSGIWKSDGGSHGVVTSGNYRKFYVRDGKKYAHTIDPRSGEPVSHNLLSATVIAADATTADALATYCMVIGLDEAKDFILGRNDLEAFLIYDRDGTMESWASPGFNLTEIR